MRNVQAASSVGDSSQSGWTNLTSVSQQGAGNQSVQHGPQQGQQQQSAQQATQFRVSRISEGMETNSFVCDLRDSPLSSPKSFSGSVRTMQFYIGDETENHLQDGEIRTIISELPSDAGEMCNILLDSGADAAVFPMQFAACGRDACETSAKLHDAQGQVIPVQSMRDVEITLMDETGKLVLLRERVAVSPHVSQPILCYGRLLQAGW